MSGNVSFVKNNGGSPPPNALKLARQHNEGDHWTAVAHTPQGDIPGKSVGNTCWYPYGGKENTTANFSWVVPGSPVLQQKNTGGPPYNAIVIGNQRDGAGSMYAGIAYCEYGTIPGKAKDNTCWYSVHGEEKYTNDFDWIVWRS